MQTGELEKALLRFQDAIEINPDSASAHAKLGSLWYQKGDIERATHSCLQALEIQSDNEDAYVTLRYNVVRYQAAKNPRLLDEVCNRCEKILEGAACSLPIRSLLGYALTKKGDNPAAVRHYQKASEQKARMLCDYVTEAQWKDARVTPPRFIIIGAFKCATTSLYQYLNQHPNVLPALEKELDFFDLQFANGLDWYLSQFPPLPLRGGFITGEGTPSYFYEPHVPERIAQALPDVKLILLLRDPIDRSVSHYHFLKNFDSNMPPINQMFLNEIDCLREIIRNGMPTHDQLHDYRYIGRSLYIFFIKNWMKVFGPDQLLIVNQSDLDHHADTVLDKVYDHVGLPPYRASHHEKHMQGRYESISAELRETLHRFFAPFNEELRDILGVQYDWLDRT